MPGSLMLLEVQMWADHLEQVLPDFLTFRAQNADRRSKGPMAAPGASKCPAPFNPVDLEKFRCLKN